MEMAASSFAIPAVAARYDRTSSPGRAGDREGGSIRELHECPPLENTGPGIRRGDNDLRLHLDLRGPSNVFRALRDPTLSAEQRKELQEFQRLRQQKRGQHRSLLDASFNPGDVTRQSVDDDTP